MHCHSNSLKQKQNELPEKNTANYKDLQRHKPVLDKVCQSIKTKAIGK